MKKVMSTILFLLITTAFLSAEIHPQAGIEGYLGANDLRTWTPWIGLRINVTAKSSFIAKYFLHNIHYEYLNSDGVTAEQDFQMSNFTGVYYAQRWGHDFYAAVSYFTGTDDYQAIALDAGTALRVLPKLSIEAGTYILNEDSTLWYPEDEERKISLYSVKGGLKYEILKGLFLTGRVNLYRNSEDVTAHSYVLDVTFVPFEPVYFNINYSRYTESAQYRFSGDYVSAGINIYY
jgi:hypothetical protein